MHPVIPKMPQITFGFLITTETALPGIFNETCVKPKKESTIVVYIRNILEEENAKF